MSDAWKRKKRGRADGDPINSEAKRGKATSRQKGRFDSGWTPTESRKRDILMKQFTRLEGASGNSAAYVAASCWCPKAGCTRLRAEGSKFCGKHGVKAKRPARDARRAP